MPLDEARRSLLDLLELNYVEIYDASRTRLSAADASRAINDDPSWSYPISDENLCTVGLTEEGERAYDSNVSRLMPPGWS